MNSYLVIKDDQVVNVVLWDGVSDWVAPDNATVELAPEGVGIGWIRVNGNWVSPEPPAPPAEDPLKASARAKLSALGLTDEEISAIVGG